MRTSARSGVLGVAALVLGLTISVTACGVETQPTYSPRVAQQLSADADAVRAAAEADDVEAAQRALRTLTRHVAAAQARGEIPSDKARQVLRATDWVAQDLAAFPTPTPTPRPPLPQPEGEEDRKKEDKAKEEAEKRREEAEKRREEAEKRREEAEEKRQEEAEKRQEDADD